MRAMNPLNVEGPKILLLIPVLNECHQIAELVERIKASLCGRDYVICFVDDGSSDCTVDQIGRERKRDANKIWLLQRVKNGPGCERGGALRAGLDWAFSEADFDVVVEMDGDLSHQPEELPVGLAHLGKGLDVVVASKYIGESEIRQRRLGRNLVSLVNSLLMRILIRWDHRDYSNGFRFYNRKAAKIVREHQFKYDGPIFLGEILTLWMKSGLRIGEFPSIYVGRQQGVSKVILNDVLSGFLAAIEISCRYHLKHFSKKKTADAGSLEKI